MQQVDDPPFLPVGTEVSAKYKGAFCEAKVRKVVRNIKCKVAYKQGLGSGTVSDELIKGVLRVGATVEVKHPDKREYVEAAITKIQDCSQYTVVFDDGDITTLRRTALCLKSGRHFNESETLDQLPLTHPEHFGNPVIGGRRGRRSRHLQDDSSDDEDDNDSKEVVSEKEEHIGKVVCVESTETKKKDKEKWFPALVVSPTAQVTVRIRVKDEYLVRSFKDGRYYTVPKKEATEFTRDMAAKQDGAAVQAALQYLDNSTLPPHWDKDALFGLANSSSEYENEFDSDSSDDEPREEKDHFVAQLYKYMDDRGTPLNKVPSITNRDVDLYRLFRAVQKLGGYNRVTSQNQWKAITMRLGFASATVSVTNLVKQAYKKFLQPFEEFDRKLGCSMSMTPRNANRSKGRSLVRANSVASPKPEPKEQKPIPAPPPPVLDEIENMSESSNDVAKSKRKLSTGSGKVKAIVDKFEEKTKEELPEPQPPSKPSKTVVKEEPIATSSPVATATASGSAKKEKNTKKAAVIPPEEKKSNRKKKDSEAEKAPTITEVTPEKDKEKDFTIDVGDKLSVYYHEKKVTYEAKVIETSLQQGVPFYLVHYTGWNTRYDEWVPRERIAENLTANKSKRGKGASQKAASNVPPNDGTKGATSSAEKLSALNVTTLTTNMPPSKGITTSKRGRGRSDSGPPRSMTPSSMASSTSRTKSPAATVNRRTTRGQPSISRRASNNVSDISMQTDSDSDSDTPVKKNVKAPPTQPSSATSSPGAPTSSKMAPSKSTTTTNSQSETEEDEIPTSSAKGRDYDLNQIRSELKGFKELKSPSPESESSIQAGGSEKKSSIIFDFDLSEDLAKKQLLSSLIPKSSTESKSSSMDLSSETDSFGDDDSQSSDKTTMLENMTEKFQQKIAQDKRLERMNSGGSDKISLKTSSIEKIIEESLAEKMQESLKSKPFVLEKSLFKPVESEIKQEVTAPEIKPAITERKPIRLSTPVEKKQPELLDVKPTVSKFEKKVVPTVDSIITPIKKELQLIKKELPIPKKELPVMKKEPPVVEASPSEKITKEICTASSSTDVYEFKEPEPFEFEARKSLASTLSAPDPEKKLKKPIVKATSDTTVDRVNPAQILAGKKKKSPVKDPDKTKQLKIEDKPPVIPDVTPPIKLTPSKIDIMLTPSKIENTFDALRKSPSFNLNISTTGEENVQSIQEMGNLFAETTEKAPLPNISTPTGETSKKMQYISPFFEAAKDTSKAFDLKADVSAIESPDKVAKATELEQVKRVLALDPVALNFEPLKVDKSKVSIADKVLKALNQQKQEEQKPKEEEKPLCPPVIEAPQISSFAINEPPKIELPAIIKKEIEIPLKKPILSSPEQKLDILESIAPKNNDLSETIQKLESVIGNRPAVDNFDEDSSDSTDSEERLVIEDDSQSSETNQTDIVCDLDVAKKPIAFGDDNLFTTSRESAFKACIPSIQPSIFNPQPSLIATGTLPVEHNTVRLEPESTLFKPIDDSLELKQDKSLPDLHIPLASLAIKKEELSPNQDTNSITQNEAINLLLCEETIPGSPAPCKESADVKPNVHPIDSDIKHIPMDIECIAQPTNDDLPAVDKVKIETNTPASSPRDSLSQDDSSEDLRKIHGQDVLASPKKRRHTRKHSECGEPLVKRRRHNTNISKRNNGSDSDDNSDANISQRSNRSSRPCQYNFTVELDPNMNPNQRIAILNKTIADLRTTYNMIKAELASIDRRRKKLRRREREKKMQQKINS